MPQGADEDDWEELVSEPDDEPDVTRRGSKGGRVGGREGDKGKGVRVRGT